MIERIQRSTLADRVSALERQNRLLRRVVYVTTGLWGVIFLVAAGPQRLTELHVDKLRVRSLEVLTPRDDVAVRLTPSALAFAGNRVGLGIRNNGSSFLLLTNNGSALSLDQGSISLRSANQHVELRPAGISIRDGDAIRAQLDQRANGGSLRLASSAGATTIARGGSIEVRHDTNTAVSIGAAAVGAGGSFKHGATELRLGATDAASALKLYKGLSVIGSFTGDSAKSRAWIEVSDEKGSQRFPPTAEEPPKKPTSNDPSQR